MKTLLCATALIICGSLTACKKGDSPAPSLPVEGKWKYDSNITTGCNSLVGTTWDVKSGNATVLSVPNADYGFKVGENMLTGITQTTNPNTYTAIGVSRLAGGAIANTNIKVNIAVASDTQSMTVVYAGVCNPNQKWIKIN